MATASEVQQQLLEEVWSQQVAYRKDSKYYDEENSSLDAVKDDHGYFDSAMNEIEDIFYPVKVAEIPAGRISIKENVGGGEGEGETRYMVFKLENQNGDVQHFRVDGYYASWDGSNWESAELYEVQKVPVQTFEYTRK